MAFSKEKLRRVDLVWRGVLWNGSSDIFVSARQGNSPYALLLRPAKDITRVKFIN